MTVSVLLEQHCNKSDDSPSSLLQVVPNCVLSPNFFPTTWDGQCEYKLSTSLKCYYNLCAFKRVVPIIIVIMCL